LGWDQLTEEELNSITSFIENATVFPLDEAIILRTITLRQFHRIRIPDVVIAAAALVHDLQLLTRNTSDFRQIPNLQLVNPFERDDLINDLSKQL